MLGASDKLLFVSIHTHGGRPLSWVKRRQKFLCEALVQQAETILIRSEYHLSENQHPAQFNDAIKSF